MLDVRSSNPPVVSEVCDPWKLRICSDILKKSLMENSFLRRLF